MEAQEFAAVVLAGGQAVRMGGADKASLEVGGSSLLEHVLTALADIDQVVVVGDPVPTSRPVTFTREDPAGGGPAAGLLAGLRGIARPPAWVLVLAVDLPLLTGDTVHRLTAAVRDDGAVLVDAGGRWQYLCAAYSVAALDRVRPSYEHEHGLAMRTLVAGLRLVEVPAVGEEARDLDTWEDLARARELRPD